jgi:hypothetical protein
MAEDEEVTTGTEEAEIAEEEETAVQQKVQEILESNLTDNDKIVALFDLGYSRQKLIKEFNFPKATVYKALPVKRDRKDLGKDEGEDNEGSKTSELPAVRKMGHDIEVITPELLLLRQMDGSEQEKWEYRGMMKLRAAMLMVMDLVSIQKTQAEAEAARLKPLLQLLAFSREEIDAATARAKNSSFEIAQVAAHQALSGYIGEIDNHLPKVPAPAPPKDMEEVMLKPISKMVDMMTDMMLAKFNPQIMDKTPGWEYEDQSPKQSPGGPTTGVAPGWEIENQASQKKEEKHD